MKRTRASSCQASCPLDPDIRLIPSALNPGQVTAGFRTGGTLCRLGTALWHGEGEWNPPLLLRILPRKASNPMWIFHEPGVENLESRPFGAIRVAQYTCQNRSCCARFWCTCLRRNGKPYTNGCVRAAVTYPMLGICDLLSGRGNGRFPRLFIRLYSRKVLYGFLQEDAD